MIPIELNSGNISNEFFSVFPNRQKQFRNVISNPEAYKTPPRRKWYSNMHHRIINSLAYAHSMRGSVTSQGRNTLINPKKVNRNQYKQTESLSDAQRTKITIIRDFSDGIRQYYSWTHKMLICRETERATTNPRLRTTSSRQGVFTGVGKVVILSFFGDLSLKNR